MSLPNFSRLRHSGVRIDDGATQIVNVTLSLSLSADVTVTGKRSFDIGELADNENLVGVALSATQGVVSAQQIDNRPIMRAGEVLEAVPGVIISQHSGEGKANQYLPARIQSRSRHRLRDDAWPACPSTCRRMRTARAIRM